MNAPLNLVGMVFGRLTVVRRDGSNSHGQARWEWMRERGWYDELRPEFRHVA